MRRAALLLIGALAAGASALSKERGVTSQIFYPDTPLLPEDTGVAGTLELDSSVSLLRLLGESTVEDLTSDASPHLHTYPPRFSPGHDLVVAWHHIPSPSFLDFVGIHCGTKAHGLDFSSVKLVGLFPGSVGSVRFKSLENRRCDWHAEYIRPSLFAVEEVSFAPDGAAASAEDLTADERSLLDSYLPGWRARPPPSPARGRAPAALTWVRAAWARLGEIAAAAEKGNSDAAAEGMLLKKTLLEHLPTVKDFIKFHVIARKHVPSSHAAAGPHHVRLSAGNDETEMFVMFTHAQSYTPLSRRHFGSAFRDDPPEKFRPTVEYGTSPDKLTAKGEGGFSETYAASDMCAAPATKVSQVDFSHPGHHHTMLMSGLEPGRRYWYRVGGDALGWTQVRSFVAMPPQEGEDKKSDKAKKETKKDDGDDIGEPPVRIVVLSDLGTHKAPRTATTLARVMEDVRRGMEGAVKREESPQEKSEDKVRSALPAFQPAPPVSLALCVGDISYARGSTLLWDRFMRMIEPVSARVPFHVTIGNHDYTYETSERGKKDISNTTYPGWHPKWGNMHHDSGGECGLPVARRFKAPFTPAPHDASKSKPVPGVPTRLHSNGVFWYATAVGPVLILAISSDHDWTNGSLQRRWLEGELAHADRKKHPFVVLAVHRPLYTTQLCEDDEVIVAKHMRESLESLLKEYKVNLVLSGHQHSYERTCPVYDGACIPQPRRRSKKGGDKAGEGSDGFTWPVDDFGGADPSEWASVDPLSPPHAAHAATITAEAAAAAAEAEVSLEGEIAECENTGVFGSSCGSTGGLRSRLDSVPTDVESDFFFHDFDENNDDDEDAFLDPISSTGPPAEDMHAQFDHVSRGTVHVIAGNGGAQAQPCGFSRKYGNFTVEHANVYGYLRLTATRRRLVVEHVRTSDGGVHDRVSIRRWKDEEPEHV